MASIRNRGRGVWQVQAYLGVDPATGRKRRTARTVHGTRRDAERVAAQLDQHAQRVARTRQHALTVPQLIARRIDARAPDWSPKTEAEARRRLRLHHDNADLPPVGQITAADIDQWRARLRQAGLGTSTIHKLNADLTAALNQAVRWDLITTNPADNLDPVKTTRNPITVPTDTHVRQLIDHAQPWLAAWIRLAATTGHRAGTIAALRWTDLDNSTVTFARAVTRGDRGLVEKTTKADRVDRVTLGAPTAGALREHRARMLERALAVGRHLPDDAFVFSRWPASDRPYDPGSVSHQFSRLRDRLGLPRELTLHGLRHYAITSMLVDGVPPSVVADRVGATTQVIDRVYRHFVPGQDQGAADMMERRLGG